MENSPLVSVIIPSLDGYRKGNVEKLLSDVREQTFKDFELKLIKGIRPNGKARNIGSQEARGQILIFIDDDVRLGHKKVFENLIKAFAADDKLAMVGASVRIYDDTSYLGREYCKIRNFTTPITPALDYEGWVQHSCLAIKKSVFEEAGKEKEDLITGTDVDLNHRIKAKGYKTAIVPNTWVYHLSPEGIRELTRKAFVSGLGSAYALEVRTEIFGLPKIKFINYQIKTKRRAAIYRVVTTLLSLPLYLLRFKPVYFVFYFSYLLGFIHGWRKFRSVSYQARRYLTPNGHNAEQYWQDRLSKYGFDLKGVCRIDLPYKENAKQCLKAKEHFLSLCYAEKIDFRKCRMLDIGCGTGFYARIFLESGGRQYLGVDITEVLFSKLRQDFPEFKFQRLDIATESLDGQFDLIIMIDVTQHITKDDKFSFAMQNIKSHLSEGGVFIVTSWVSSKARRSFYEVSRPLEAYKKEFPDYRFSKPLPFRDKFIFSISKSVNYRQIG